MSLYEYWNEADPVMTWVHGDFWQGQTFMPQVDHTITSVKLKMYRHGLPGTLTVSIRDVDVDGHPKNIDMSLGSTDGDTLPTAYAGEWREISMGAGGEVGKDTPYCIIVRALSGDQNNYVRWLSSTAKPYTRGTHEFSSNGGASWDTNTTRDMMFKEYGTP